MNVDRDYTVNGLNQLITAGGLTLNYDNSGNLQSDGSNTYSYDVENRLLGVTGSNNATLSYDPLGRLNQTIGSGITTRFGYDGADLIAEYNATGAITRRYVHGPGTDDPILWYEGAGTSDKRYLSKDERGSVTAITSGTGALIGINSYDGAEGVGERSEGQQLVSPMTPMSGGSNTQDRHGFLMLASIITKPVFTAPRLAASYKPIPSDMVMAWTGIIMSGQTRLTSPIQRG